MSDNERGNDDDLSLPKGTDPMTIMKQMLQRDKALGALPLTACCIVSTCITIATVQKLINEMMPDDIACAKDTRDLLIECCVGMDIGEPKKESIL
jgi:hypothetical protein